MKNNFASAAVSRPTRLTKDGVNAWLDKEQLLPGHDWEFEIRQAVREAGFSPLYYCLKHI